MFRNTTLITILLFSLLASLAFAGEGNHPTDEKAQHQTNTAATPAELSLEASSATAQLTPVEHAAPITVPATESANEQAGASKTRGSDLRIGERASGVVTGIKDWFSSRRIFKKREAIASDSGMTLAGMVRIGIILMVVGLAVMILAIILDGSLGALLYSLGGVLLVVGLVLLILGLVGII